MKKHGRHKNSWSYPWLGFDHRIARRSCRMFSREFPFSLQRPIVVRLMWSARFLSAFGSGYLLQSLHITYILLWQLKLCDSFLSIHHSSDLSLFQTKLLLKWNLPCKSCKLSLNLKLVVWCLCSIYFVESKNRDQQINSQKVLIFLKSDHCLALPISNLANQRSRWRF